MSVASFYAVEDYVFLQHVIVFKRDLPRLEHVNAAKRERDKEQFSERLEVRAVAEAARGNGDKFTAWREEREDDRQEPRV